MKLIIDIPDRIYKIVQNRTLNITDDEILENALKNGTPLPKGHGRLIDADVLVDGMEDDFEFCEVVNATPTIIQAESEDK